MSDIKQTLTAGTIAKWFFMVLLPVAIYLIPTNEVFTPQLRWFLVWTVWLLYCSAVDVMPLFIPTFLTPVLWMLSGAVPAATAFSGWVSPIMWTIIGAFLLAGALDDCGLLSRISYWLIIKVGGTLSRVCWAMFLVGFVLCAITFSNAYIIMAPFTYGVAKSLIIKLPSKEGLVIMTSALLGVLSTRFFIYAPSVILMLQQGASAYIPGYVLPWYQYILYNIPTVIFLVGFIFFMLKVFKIHQYDGEINMAVFEGRMAEMGKMSSAEKKAVVALILVMGLLLTSPLTGIETTVPFMIIPILMFAPKIEIATPSAMAKSIDFPMVCFIAACIGIGNGCAALGVGSILVSVMTPLLAGQSVWVMIMGILLLGTLANFAMTPVAMLVSLSGPLAVLATSVGLPVTFAMFALAHATDMIFLPYEFVPYLIFFSFGFCSMVDFIKLNTVRVLSYFVFFGAIMIPFWLLLGI